METVGQVRIQQIKGSVVISLRLPDPAGKRFPFDCDLNRKPRIHQAGTIILLPAVLGKTILIQVLI
jgi:hypothetical protein